MIEYEEKFLDINYIKTRLNDFKDIKNGTMKYSIHKSDREYSNSFYVDFYYNGQKRSQLRISDHIVKTDATQFIVTPQKVLNKKKKEQFVKMVESAIIKAKKNEVYRKMKMVERHLEDV